MLGLAAFPSFAQAEVFLDVVGHPQSPQIETLHERGIVQGYGYGLYRPDIPVNRAEYLKMLTLAVVGKVPTSDATGCFRDFRGEEQWFWASACAAKEYGVTEGYPDGTFRGEKTVIVAEALKMAAFAWNIPLPRYVRAPEHWYDPYVDAVRQRGIMEYFLGNPAHALTRGDVAWLFVALGQPLATVDASAIALDPFMPETTVPSVHTVCGDGEREGAEQCDDGNREDGDGCSSLCIIVTEPIQHAAIRIDQRAAGVDARAGGTSQTTLFSFDAGARWQQAVLTGLKFKAVSGQLAAAVNYRLYQDEDGDGRAESLVGSGLVRDSVLSFSNIAPVIHTERGTRFSVRGDLLPSAGTQMSLGFLTTDLTYVEAVGSIDGRELTGIRTDQDRCPAADNCWIVVYTKPAASVTVTARGNLLVTQSSEPVRSRQLLMGSVTEDLLRISMRATEEDIRVTRIAVEGATDDLSHVELFFPGETAPFTTATAVQCRTPGPGRFCARTDFTLRKDLARDILFRGAVQSEADGAVSGRTIALRLSEAFVTDDPAVEARGESSQQQLIQNDGDADATGEIFISADGAGPNVAIIGPVHDVVAAKFLSVSDGSADPDGSPVPQGQSAIAAFRFSAASFSPPLRTVRQAGLRSLTFNVAAANIRFSAGSFTLANTFAPHITALCTETAVTGAFRVTCSALDRSGVNVFFDQGTSATFTLSGFVESGPVTPGGMGLLQVSLAKLNDRSASGVVEWTDGVSAFTWMDVPTADVRSVLYRTP